jgi:hypothetical protein
MVVLTPYEKRMCAWVGKHRWEHARAAGRDPGLGPTATAVDAYNDIRGAECEYAGSIMLNMYWRPTIGRIDTRDVGGLIEVRSGERINDRMIVKPNAVDEAPYALVLRLGSGYHFKGWLFAKEAKLLPLLTEHGDPAHFVPQKDLHNFASLRKWARDADHT